MSSILNRMSEVVLALNEARLSEIQPTKIQLQKFVYLCDVLGQIVGRLKPVEAHKTYRNGPYDPAVQNAVDSLAFRGLVRIAGVWRTPSGHLSTKYTLADPGDVFLNQLKSHRSLEQKVLVASLVGTELQALGWDRIVSLVYAEPTFVATRPFGWGAPLEAENGLKVSTAFLVAIMRRVSETLSLEVAVRPEWLADRFFAYLSDYDVNYNSPDAVP